MIKISKKRFMKKIIHGKINILQKNYFEEEIGCDYYEV